MFLSGTGEFFPGRIIWKPGTVQGARRHLQVPGFLSHGCAAGTCLLSGGICRAGKKLLYLRETCTPEIPGFSGLSGQRRQAPEQKNTKEQRMKMNMPETEDHGHGRNTRVPGDSGIHCGLSWGILVCVIMVWTWKFWYNPKCRGRLIKNLITA